jgi:3-methyl-2-oxobutanoate hydroxymethyltransferase
MPTTADHGRQTITLAALVEKKRRGQPIVMVTAYDYPSALAVEQAEIDLVLAGDTGAELMMGYRGTSPVSLDEMLNMTRAVRRGLSTPLLIGDLPFGSYETSDQGAVATAMRFVKEAGCDVVKLERGGSSAERARAIVASGIPVMGHIGLTPQTETALGGRRAQGRTASRALELLSEARRLEAAGCFALVMEAVAAPVAREITNRLSIPTIGIGAGGGTDGQVLVWHDLLGLYESRPRFAHAFVELRPLVIEALRGYATAVQGHDFPAQEHCYSLPEEEFEHFLQRLEECSE